MSSYSYSYPKTRTTTTVTVYEYNDKGDIVKETVTVTTSEPVQDYSWNPYGIIGGGITPANDKYTVTYNDGNSLEN